MSATFEGCFIKSQLCLLIWVHQNILRTNEHVRFKFNASFFES